MTTINSIASADSAVLVEEHEHSWETQSTHHTSDGIVQYLQCRHCHTHQMRQLGYSKESTLDSKEIRA